MPSFTASVQNMQNVGPIVEVQLAVSQAAEEAFRTGGNQPPSPIGATAMIDTGAGITVIQAGLAGQLGIEPIGITYISTPSSQNVRCYKYQIRVVFSNNVIAEASAVEAPLQGQHIQCLIGRDILADGVLIYNGYMNQFTLSF